MKPLIYENSKPQDLKVYTDSSVTKDQSGLGFNVKQGATTINQDSAANTVSTSSLTMEVEYVTHALHWIASRVRPHTPSSSLSTNLLQKVRSGMGYSPDCNVKTPAGHGHAPACEAYEGK